MDGIYHTILLNDVVKRLKISDVNMLESVTRYLMHNIGNRTTPTTIANTMVSKGRKIDPKTVDRYLRGLTDSLLFYEARRYNIKGKELLNSISKYYVRDVAMRNMLVRGKDTDIGHILENLVYLELRRQALRSMLASMVQTVRLTLWLLKMDTLNTIRLLRQRLRTRYYRELAPLRKIQDNFPKYLITLDEIFGEMNYEGIQKKNALKWMLGQGQE